MIIVKSQKDLVDIKKAGEIWTLLKNYVIDLLDHKKDYTLAQLDDLIDKFIISQGGSSTFYKMYDFPKHVCISVNDCVIHGIPDNYKIKDTDKITFDMGVTYNNHICDAAFNYLMPNCPQNQKEIVKVCEQSLQEGLKMVKAGAHVGDIGYAIEKYVTEHGYYLLEGFSGHGCGNQLHEDPAIYNSGRMSMGAKLKENMVICIEPMILEKSPKYYIKNHWNVISSVHAPTAHCEAMVLVTKDGYELLSK